MKSEEIMTDLEICKRIAEIEGECIEHIHGDVLFVSRTEDVFNPLQDKALCFDLMVKHRVDVEWWKGECSAYIGFKDGEIHDKNPQRAICLAIIEANKEQ